MCILVTTLAESLLNTLDSKNIEKNVTNGISFGTVHIFQTIVEHFIAVAVRLGGGGEIEDVVPCLEWLHLEWNIFTSYQSLNYERGEGLQPSLFQSSAIHQSTLSDHTETMCSDLRQVHC